jgi:hypothetical protein
MRGGGRGRGDERTGLASAELLDLAQEGAALDQAGVRQRDLGGLIEDLVGVEADPAQDEALLQRPDVAAVQPSGEAEGGQRAGGRDREEHGRGGGRDERQDQRDRAASEEGPQLVHRHVHHRLGATFLRLGQGRVKQLVRGAEERVRERLVGPAGEGRRGEPGKSDAEERARRGEGRAQGERAGDAEVAQRGAADRRLHDEAEDAHPPVEDGEGAEE